MVLPLSLYSKIESCNSWRPQIYEVGGLVAKLQGYLEICLYVPILTFVQELQGSKLQQKSAFPSEKLVWNLLFRTPKHFSESIPATENFVIVLNAYKSKWLLFCWISHFLNFENRSSTSDFYMALFHLTFYLSRTSGKSINSNPVTICLL